MNLDLAISNLRQPDYDRLVGASVAKRRCLENASMTTPVVEEHFSAVTNEDHFFETVSDQCRCERITMFIDTTGSKATALAICVVCAGFFFHAEVDSVLLHFLQDTENWFRLLCTHTMYLPMECYFIPIHSVTTPILQETAVPQLVSLASPHKGMPSSTNSISKAAQ